MSGELYTLDLGPASQLAPEATGRAKDNRKTVAIDPWSHVIVAALEAQTKGADCGADLFSPKKMPQERFAWAGDDRLNQDDHGTML